MTIAVYDTSCGSLNSGDEIIMDAVDSVLQELFPMQHKVAYPTHYPLSLKAVRRIKKSRVAFVGGTNLLSSTTSFWPARNQWAVGCIESWILNKKAVLLGCRWNAYQRPPNLWSRLSYRTILSDCYVHSVRDSHSENMLRRAGISNILTTGCPTMWALTDDHCRDIPREKAHDVLFTLTDYRRAPKEDFALIQLLRSSYRRLYFWAQGSKDLDYFSSLMTGQSLGSFELLGPSLASFDSTLRNTPSIEYVGTRLHAGIRALQMKKRSIVIGVDNRALEKQRDFNLQIVERGNLSGLSHLMNGSFETNLRIPLDRITAWKAQFAAGKAPSLQR